MEIYFIKCGGCGIPHFTATPILSANLHWHATDTHCFLSMISLHSLKALKNVFRLIHNSIKLNDQHIWIRNIFIINNKTWILRQDNLRSMKHLDEKWPQRAKVELIQTWKNHLWRIQFQPNFQGSSECCWKIIVGSLKGVALFIWTPHPLSSYSHTCAVLGSKNVISSKFTNNFEQKCHSYQRPFTLLDQSVRK